MNEPRVLENVKDTVSTEELLTINKKTMSMRDALFLPRPFNLSTFADIGL